MNLKRAIALSSLILLACATGPCPRCERDTVLFGRNHEVNVYMLDMGTRVIQKKEFPGDITGAEFAYNDRRKLLAFITQATDDEFELYLYEFTTGRTSLVYRSSPEEVGPSSPAFHPGGDRLFWIGGRIGGSGKIFEYRISTKRLREVEVVNSEGLEFWGLCFSRTGQLVALSPAHCDGVFIGRFDGSRIVIREQILRGCGFFVGTPAWIGDDQIVFSGGKADDDLTQVWRLSLGDKTVVPLTGDTVDVGLRISVSRDGKWVIFAGRKARPDDSAIWRVSVDGRKMEELTATFEYTPFPIRID